MRILQVSEFIEVVNIVLKESFGNEEIGVEGEVSGFRISQGQWVSFDLKDDKALVNVFLPVWNLRVPVEDGFRVRVIGLPRVYPKYGKFSLSAERIELAGEGALKKALALLRARLEKEGIFDSSRKRELPRFPQRIALVASRESAAYGDFIRILSERWGGIEIDLYHVLVQGERAPQDIVHAIQTAQLKDYDALVMTRGGGSLEELMAFNDEQVVRTVYASKIPTLVAIGHERDMTLAEEAADVRASTPTDCARRLAPDRRDVQYELSTLLSGVEARFGRVLEDRRNILEHALNSPVLWLSSKRAALSEMRQACDTGVKQWLNVLRERLESRTRLLASLDPKAVLRRGYALVRDTAGKGIVSVATLKVGQSVSLVLQDGEAETRILKTTRKTDQASISRQVIDLSNNNLKLF
ncbi:exodeoxyribonuclease VII large subunit [Patescibacteria group bacterium]|nr:exodeoxyribonuclease VII large subunit [Patescibacteria group bacterium]MBU1034266.1 exodeoxyribonuclease VII large subunit [Patescibacteria group bacterium]MBU1630121.1 exodeoxyribonuclease VII large subunit [Patescibacteria group bacterium]MBU1908199.1 exodeoxyribonuclease VII large subunit [Patescibacteria group bacterium]